MRNPVRAVRTWWRRRGEDALTDPVLPAEATPPVAELLEALTAEARPHELLGLAESLSLYRAGLARPAAPVASTRRTPVLTTLIGARTGAAIAGVAVGLGAASLVAYSAIRPSTEPVMISPAATSVTPSPDAKRSDRPVGPDATGPAAFGLCNAWANHQKQQDGIERAEDSIAMRNLAAAAGGEGKIAAYCATIPHPGNGPKVGRTDKGDKPPKAKPKPAGPKARATSPATSPAPSSSPTPSVSRSPED